MPLRDRLDQMTFRRLYHTNRLTLRDIAALYGTSPNAIRKLARQYGVPMRLGVRKTTSEANPTRAREIALLYKLHGLSGVQIARRYGCSAEVVYKTLEQIGISRRNSRQAACRREDRRDVSLVLDQCTSEVLDGELLGDACLTRETVRSAVLVYGTSRRMYLEWLVQLLANGGMAGTAIYSVNGGTAFVWSSRSYPALKTLRRRWYPAGVKVVPPDLILTPTVCRHWYIGDGRLANHRYARSICLYTCAFAEADNCRLASQLSNIVGDVRVRWKTVQDKRYPFLYVTAASSRRFLDYIGPCPIEIEDVYGYKWRMRQLTGLRGE